MLAIGVSAAAGLAAAAAGVIVLAGNPAPVAAVATMSQECAEEKAALVRIEAEIASLESARLPADSAREMIAVIDELVAGLKTVEGATESVIGPTTAAQEKLDKIAENLTAAGGQVPAGWPRLRAALGTMGERIDAGTKAYKATAAGRAVGNVEAAAKQIKPAIEKLEEIKGTLEGVLAYDNARYGTGAEQIMAMKYGFDRLKDSIGADEVPGLGQMLDAYSQAMEGISVSVGRIEEATKAKLRMADQALADSPVGPENLNNLYPGLLSQREKMAARLEALRAMRTRLVAGIAEKECDKPPPPRDPCTEPGGEMDRVRRQLDQLTGDERDELGDRRRDYVSLFNALAIIDLNQELRARSRPPASGKVLQQRDRLGDLKLAAVDSGSMGRSRLGNEADTLEAARVLARDLKLDDLSRARDDIGTLRRLIARIEPALAAREAATRQAETAEQERAVADWRLRHGEALAAFRDGERQRENAKAALDQRVTEVVRLESQSWSAAKLRLFEQCFPSLAARRLPPVPPPAPPPAAAPPPVAPAAPPAPAPAPAAAAAPAERECVRGGGLVGAVNDVTCKMGN